MFHVLVESGHRLDDLKHVYTIDQVNLFYEKQIMRDMAHWHMDAIITGNALAYASPATDQKHARKKNEGWSKFIDSLDWSKMSTKKHKEKLTVKDVLGPLGMTSLIKVKEGDK